MKILLLVASIIFMQACSDDRGSSTISNSECESVGGTIIDGQCRQPVDPEQMKSICKSQNMKYVEKFNGCIEK